MTTWDDKPNDYKHACAMIERLEHEICSMAGLIERLQAAVEKRDADISRSYEVGKRDGIEASAQVAERFMEEQRSKGIIGARAIEVLTVAVVVIRAMKDDGMMNRWLGYEEREGDK